MKKRTLTLLLTPLIALLCSCSVIGAADYTNFKKQGAIKKVGNTYSLVNRKVKQNPVSIQDDFYKINATTFASIYTNKEIKARGLTKHMIGNNVFYENQEYGGTFIDAFGDEIDKKIPTNQPSVQIKYVIVSENSSFYRYVSGKKSSSTKLHFLECTKFNVNKVTYGTDACYIVKEVGDTRFHARNIFFDDKTLFNFDKNTYNIGPNTYIQKLNNSEYIIGDKSVYFSRFKQKDDSESEEVEKEPDTQYKSLVVSSKRIVDNPSGYYCILNIPFAGTNYNYQYFIREAQKGESYTFYSHEKYYSAFEETNGQKYEVDYVPVIDSKTKKAQIRISKDNQEAYLLCKKIKDGEFAKGDYVIKLNYKGDRSDFSSDTSIFEESNPYYYFHDGYHELTEGCQILYLNKDILVVNNGRSNIIVADDGYNTSLSSFRPMIDATGQAYGYGDTCWFVSSSGQVANYDKKFGDAAVLSGARIIDPDNCLYRINNQIFYFDMRISLASEFKNHQFYDYSDFGKNYKVGVFNTEKNAYIFHLGEK